VFRLIAGQGQHGATIDEIDQATGLGQSSICPRVKTLEQQGRIWAHGDERKTRKGRMAKVWRVVTKR